MAKYSKSSESNSDEGMPREKGYPSQDPDSYQVKGGGGYGGEGGAHVPQAAKKPEGPKFS